MKTQEITKEYPTWICHDCASKAGGQCPGVASFHPDICDICNAWKSVTEPRDYGYPRGLKRNRDIEKIRKELTLTAIHHLIMRRYEPLADISKRLANLEGDC